MRPEIVHSDDCECFRCTGNLELRPRGGLQTEMAVKAYTPIIEANLRRAGVSIDLGSARDRGLTPRPFDQLLVALRNQGVSVETHGISHVEMARELLRRAEVGDGPSRELMAQIDAAHERKANRAA